jgi:TolA-binding protein
LFAQAVEARRAGHADRAISLFRELQTTYPATSEARVTLLSLGDLLMGRADPASALAAFDEYLERNPQGALVPEALNGRARALTALGRRHDAEETLRDLDTRLPGSPYTRAHGALRESVRP